MWTVVYIVPNKNEAKRIQQLLSSEGLLVKLRSPGLYRQKKAGLTEILVPESEASEAAEIINLYNNK